MTAPIAIERLEDAFATWLRESTGATVYQVEPEDSGAVRPAPPAVQITWPTYIPLSRPGKAKIPSIMKQQIDVLLGGPGSIAIDFYLAFDPTPQRIEAALLPGDDAAAARTKLLAELVADLPAGVTATADPGVDTRILVEGSEGFELFACEAAEDPPKTQVTTLLERFPELETEWVRLVWRMQFRSTQTRGFGSAADLMTRARASASRKLAPLLRKAGFQYKGTPFTSSAIPGNRNESTAALDIAAEGWATAAFQSPAIRRVGLQFNHATP